MRRLEIVHLRSSAEPLESLSRRIKESIGREARDQEAVITIYRRCGLDTDLAVHILHHRVSDRRGPSDLALRLASALRAYGLVEHTLWEELE